MTTREPHTLPLPLPALAVEWFVAANLSFLGGDILLAHGTNAFRNPLEWLPLAFSALAGPALAMALWRQADSGPWRLGWIVGIGSIVVGIGGFLLHLESQFFQVVSMRSLVYTAPLAAPLAYAGLGFLLLLNRMVAPHSVEWSRWAAVLAAGGWAGNVALALMDHAQNGFFYWTEWLPVTASAFTLALLSLTILWPGDLELRRATAAVLGIAGLVGVLGFFLHLRAIVTHPAERLLDAVLYRAPPFAPLLLVDLAVLGGIVLLAMGGGTTERRQDGT